MKISAKEAAKLALDSYKHDDFTRLMYSIRNSASVGTTVCISSLGVIEPHIDELLSLGFRITIKKKVCRISWKSQNETP